MFLPISWLQDYISLDWPIDTLSWKLTEIGISVETVKKINGEIVLELEITPNRPDLLSVIGIAREIAAITGKKIKYPNILLSEKKENLPLTVNINFDLFFIS